MDPVKAFRQEREHAIAAYAQDAHFRALSQSFLQSSMDKRYVYNFDWLGRPIIQYPQDICAVQEIVWSTRPDVIIETGIAHGGSLILSASLLAMLDYADAVAEGTVLDPAAPRRRVIGVDIDIREHNRAAIEVHPMASRIKMIEGSSIDHSIVEQVKDAMGDASRVDGVFGFHAHSRSRAGRAGSLCIHGSRWAATASCSTALSRMFLGTSSQTVPGMSATTPRLPCTCGWQTIPTSRLIPTFQRSCRSQSVRTDS